MANHENNLFAIAGIALSSILKLSPKIASSILINLFPTSSNQQEFSKAYSYTYPNLPALTVDIWVKAQIIYEKCNALHIEVIPIVSQEYPPWLKSIDNPPSVLYARGNLGLLKTLGVAVVGTRKATNTGRVIANRISKFFSANNWTVISGLALGIDASAHSGVVEVEGKTIAVLAHGLEKASPKSNAGLADEILLNNGLWISEHPVGTPAQPEYFVMRNRIQIGLSAGSVIVEGEEKSGTTTQANFCVKEGRALFVVLPPADRPDIKLLSEGPLALRERLNAIPIYSKDDYPKILSLLEARRNQILQDTCGIS